MKARIASWAVLLALCVAFGILLMRQPGVGSLEGRILLPNHRPLGRILVIAEDRDGRRFRTRTDRDGNYRFRRLPVGAYEISTGAEYHTGEAKQQVREAETRTANLQLVRSAPALNLVDSRQSIWSTNETPRLPVGGFVDGKPLRVSLWRVRPSALLRTGKGFGALRSLDQIWDDKVPTSLPAPLRADGPPTAQVSLPAGDPDREGFFTTRLTLPAPKGRPGLYIVRVDGAGSQIFSWVLVTDIAIVTKRPDNGESRTLVYAVHQNTGKPLPGARIERIRDGRPTGPPVVADASGIAWLPKLPLGHAEHTDVLVASLGDDQGVLADRMWAHNDDDGRMVIHLMTDRTIYRPGHVIHYKGIARRRPDPTEPYRYAVPVGEPVQVVMRDATGVEIGRSALRTGPGGSFAGSFATSPEAPTGGFRLEATVAGTTSQTTVPVASYRKPEFEVKVTPEKSRALTGETVAAKIDATYYFGAPVAGAKVTWRVYAEADWQAEVEDAAFWEALDDDERRYGAGLGNRFYGSSVADGEGRLDPSGHLDIRFPARLDPQWREEDAIDPQAMVYTITASVTDPAEREESGEGAVRVTSAEKTVSVSPDGYLGKPGDPKQVFVLARDLDGKPSPGTAVALQAYTLVQEKLVRDEDDPSTWQGTRQVRRPQGPPLAGTTGADGRAILTLTPPRAGDLELEATLRTASGRVARSTSSLWVASDRDTDLDTVYDDLTVLTDKRLYHPGDTARVLVNAARTGQNALLTVESDQIHAVFPIPIRQRSTLVPLPILESYGPNVTLSVCYVRDKRFASASVPLRVTLPERTLQVTVTPARADARPGESVACDVRIRDAAGRPVAAEFSLAAVDEAIYALQPDDPKDLRDAFYPRRGNRMTTSHSFEIPYLGGDEKGDMPVKPRSRFLDTAFWAPSLRTGADGNARVEIPLPDNLTAWRVTVRAVTDADTRVGYGRGVVTVNKPFFLRLEAPRFISEGDSARLLALVHNDTGREQRVQVRLAAAGLIGDSPEVQSVTVPAGKVGTVTWKLEPRAPADLRLQCTAWTEDRAFSDGVLTRLDVRPFGRTTYWNAAGSQDEPLRTIDVPVSPGSVAGERRLQVRVALGLGGPVAAAVGYLVDYPYGCTEQTVSRLWPLVRIGRSAPTLLTPDQTRVIAQRTVDGLARLRRFQHPSGGWGWWETGNDDPFLTAYVLDALLDLRASGASVPQSMVADGVRALQQMRKARKGIAPYGRLVLARAGVLLKDPLPAPKGMPPSHLAWTILLAREMRADPAPYRAALRRLEQREGPLSHWTFDDPKQRFSPDTSARMETAAAVRALLALDPNDPSARAGIRWLVTERTGDSFGDTRDTAFVLAALDDYLRTHPDAAQTPGAIAARVNGVAVALEGDTHERLARVPSRLLRPGANVLELRCDGGDPGSVFWSASLRQLLPGDPNSGLEPLAPDGVTLGREYLRLGDAGKEPTVETRFAAGDLVEVRLAVVAPREMYHVMVEDLFPAGFEPTERGTADVDVSGSGWYEPYDHLDVRDDRVTFFFTRIEPGKHVYTYHLRAQTPGRYRIVPGSLTPMYQPSLRVESRDSRVEVAP